MHVLLDHISSIMIAGVLFIAVFTMMQRNQQNAMEMQVNNMVSEQAYHFLNMMERDIENMLHPDQLDGIALDPTCTVSMDPSDTTLTRSFSFPSMEVFTDTSTGIPVDSVARVHLTYQLTPTLKKAIVNGVEKPLYKIDRIKQNEGVGGTAIDGTSGEIITNFSVTLFNEDGGVTPGACPEELGNTKVQFEAASEISFESADERVQKSRTNLNTTRYGATIYSPNR